MDFLVNPFVLGQAFWSRPLANPPLQVCMGLAGKTQPASESPRPHSLSPDRSTSSTWRVWLSENSEPVQESLTHSFWRTELLLRGTGQIYPGRGHRLLYKKLSRGHSCIVTAEHRGSEPEHRQPIGSRK